MGGWLFQKTKCMNKSNSDLAEVACSGLCIHHQFCWLWLCTYFTEERELVVREEAVGFVQEEVPPDELLEAPVLALDEAVCSLAF